MNILQINTSIRGDQSHSTRIANSLVARLRALQPAAHAQILDLAQQPPLTLDAAALEALGTPAAQRSAVQAGRVAADDALIAELMAADIVVLGVPMYNFAVPVQLKSWIDAIGRAGVTFRYDENGPHGLVQGKKVFIVLSRGGRYRDTEADSQVPYLKTALGFLGMTDITWIYAEGLNMGEESQRQTLTEIAAQIAAITL
jgi:FMN-dependent NADH-azoreductase